MLFVVDGTGPEDPTEYEREMSGSFCRQLQDKCGGTYWRGPTLLGNETIHIAKKIVEEVVRIRRGPDAGAPIFLAGHSRGGAAVLFAAQDLDDMGIEVEAMFLYDAVNRTLNNLRFRSSDYIPKNVRFGYHALRDPSLSFYYSDGLASARDQLASCMGLPTGKRPSTMEDLIDMAIAGPVKASHPYARQINRVKDLTAQDMKMKVVMRSLTMTTPDGLTLDFGNCATKAEGGCKLVKAYFLGSHGAIGGAPIVSELAPKLLIESDRAAMASVSAWMSGHLSRHGLFVRGKG